MFVVWTGHSPIKIGSEIVPAWTPIELGINAVKWMVTRSLNYRPLVSPDEAIDRAHNMSEASLRTVCEQCKIENSREALIARLGGKYIQDVVAVASPPVVATQPDEEAETREKAVVRLRNSGATWSQIGEQFGIAESTARAIFARETQAE